MSEILTIYQIISSSIGVMGVFVVAWIFLVQKDFQNRFSKTKQIIEMHRNNQKEELKNNLIKNKNENKYLTEKLISEMNILAIIKENIKERSNKMNKHSKEVVFFFASVIIYAIFIISEPEKQAIVIKGTRIKELHYLFVLFISIFAYWFFTLLNINQKMNDFENKELDEVINDYNENNKNEK